MLGGNDERAMNATASGVEAPAATGTRSLFFDLSERFGTPAHTLTEILYVSRRHERFDDSGVINMVVDAAVRNFLAGVSGRLWYTPRYFAQVLEGTQATVEAFYDRIRMDARHADVTLVRQRKLPYRRFDRPMWVFAGNEDPMMRRLLEVPPGDARDFDTICANLMSAAPSRVMPTL